MGKELARSTLKPIMHLAPSQRIPAKLQQDLVITLFNLTTRKQEKGTLFQRSDSFYIRQIDCRIFFCHQYCQKASQY